jgi:hypothetical protein
MSNIVLLSNSLKGLKDSNAFMNLNHELGEVITAKSTAEEEALKELLAARYRDVVTWDETVAEEQVRCLWEKEVDEFIDLKDKESQRAMIPTLRKIYKCNNSDPPSKDTKEFGLLFKGVILNDEISTRIIWDLSNGYNLALKSVKMKTYIEIIGSTFKSTSRRGVTFYIPGRQPDQSSER